MFLLLAVAILLLFIYVKVKTPLQYWEKRGIKHIKSWPVVGSVLPIVLQKTSLVELVHKFYNTYNERYFGAHLFMQPIIIIKDIDLIKQVCIKEFDHFVDHKSFFSETREPVFSQNLFSSKGQEWRELRSVLSPTFTGSKMRAMFKLMSDCSERFTSHFEKTMQPNETVVMEMKELFTRYLIDVIGTCAYGVESDSLAEKTNDFYMNSKNVGDFSDIKRFKSFGFMICPRVMRFFGIRFYNDDNINFFRNIVTSAIAHREKFDIQRPDLIHLMMLARKGQLKYDESSKDDVGFATAAESDVGKNINSNLQITDDLITAQAMVFFIGGAESSSLLISFVSYELAVNEDIQRRLQDEIDDVAGSCNDKVTYDLIQKMKYMDLVVSETLRKWPQAFFLDRLCVKDFRIEPKNPGEKPFVIEKGDVVWIPTVGLHKDPEYWPEPDRFDPERFNDDNKGNINPYTFIPFGLGPRNCIGNRFALLETKTLLFHLLHKFDIVVVDKTDVPLKFTTKEIFPHPENGFWLGLKQRQ